MQVESITKGWGRTVYDDGVARAADLGEGKFMLECAGHSICFDLFEIAEAMAALRKKVGGAMSLMEASRAILDDVEDSLPPADSSETPQLTD